MGSLSPPLFYIALCSYKERSFVVFITLAGMIDFLLSELPSGEETEREKKSTETPSSHHIRTLRRSH